MQRYQKCLTCEKRGESCDGPNLLTLSAPEIIEFCKSIRLIRGMSVADVAEGSGIPKGTIGRIFSSESTIDFRYETIRAIALFLCGCKFLGNPCPTPDGWEIEHLKEVIRHQEESIATIRQNRDRSVELHDSLRRYHNDYVRFMRRLCIILVSALILTAGAVAAFLIADYLNPNIGFFWLNP